MGFLSKLFSGKGDDYEEKKELVNLSFDELKKQVNASLRRVNDLGDKNYVGSVTEILSKIKGSINSLMARELNSEYNKALLIGANNARKRVNDQLKPLLNLKGPNDLVGVNAFIKDAEKLLTRAHEVSTQSTHAQVLFRDEMNKLGSAFDDLAEEVDKLKSAVSERNDQLTVFNQLVKEIRTYDEAVKRLDEIKKEEFDCRKKISSHDKDKAFMNAEIARIKSLDAYKDLSDNKNTIDSLSRHKQDLEGQVMNLVSKFSRVVKKVFKGDDFVDEFLANPLLYISKNEGEFNRRMRKLINEINSNNVKVTSKDKDKYLKVLTDDKINDYIDSYKDLIKKERSLKGADFSIIKKAEAFERRLMELNAEVNSHIKELDTFKDRIEAQQREVEALRAKVESMASECYSENVRLS